MKSILKKISEIMDILRSTLMNHLASNRGHYESKILKDLLYLATILKYIETLVPGFIKYGITLLIVIFIVRGTVNGFAIPYSITYIVDGLKNSLSEVFMRGVYLLIISGILFAITEILLMIYFKRLTRGIVVTKEKLLNSFGNSDRNNNHDPDDLVGRIANDVDFVFWNINGVITTLLPNLFTSIMSVAAVYSFNHFIGIFITITMLPYIIYTELYSRKAETYRLTERRTYSLSISYIKNLIYGEKVNGDLFKVLREWNISVDKILWLDRYFWSISLTTALGSLAGIALLSSKELNEGRINIATLSGLLSASLTAHFSMVNTMWALCVQGQTVAAIKRVAEYLDIREKKYVIHR